MRSIIRPTCQHTVSTGIICNNPAVLVKSYSSGGNDWRRYNGLWTCHYCHAINTPNYKPHMSYTRYKKHYCENIDGRLGKICTTNITHPKELTVDHIDGDHSNDDIENLQTLCASCHNLKTHQDYANKGTCPTRDKSGTPLEGRYPDMWGAPA